MSIDNIRLHIQILSIDIKLCQLIISGCIYIYYSRVLCSFIMLYLYCVIANFFQYLHGVIANLFKYIYGIISNLFKNLYCAIKDLFK